MVGVGAITLDASASADPDGQGGLSFQWSCAVASAASTSDCRSADGAPLGPLPPGPVVSLELEGGTTGSGRNHTLTVVVSKGGRLASASVWLAVRANARIPVISLSGLAASKVNPQDKLTLSATVDSGFPDTLRTKWEVVGGGLNLSAPGVAGTELSSQSLVVLPNALAPRSSVQFRCGIRIPTLPKCVAHPPPHRHAAFSPHLHTAAASVV